jgi:hypothetical protein
MQTDLAKEQARSLLKAALLGMLAAEATTDGYPDSITAHLSLGADGDQSDGNYEVCVEHGVQHVPVAGASL